MLTVDGRTYNVYIIFPTRELEFEIVEGDNSGMSLSYREIRDIGGTRYNYTMRVEPDPFHPEDFDALFWTLSAPVASHTVIMPLGQGELEFEAAVRSGKITDHGESGGYHRWKNMVINFNAIEPQRRPE